MKKNIVSKTFLPLVFIYILLVVTLGALSHKFFIKDFIYLEEQQNLANISSFNKYLEDTIFDLEKVTSDYSKWDETYEFINNENDIYIYDNFREESLTLEQLAIDGFIFVNKDSHIVFSTYNKNIKKEFDKKEFENFILKKLSKDGEFNSLINYKNNILFFSKTKILRSDHLGESRGYLISITFLDEKELDTELQSVFDSFHFIYDEQKKLKEDMTIDLKYAEKEKIFINYEDEKIKNIIQMYDFNGDYVASIVTSNKNLIILQGKHTIKIFNFIGSIILFFVFIFIFQKQKLIIEQNELLNEKVEKRTTQLTKAYRSLKDKNHELYKIANTDSLTSIRNRANFFRKSIKLLEQSNLENKNFSVLMMDIDYFKKINDNYGHSVGDKVLIGFCETICPLVDKNMVFGRLGGEEFAISLFDKGEDEVNRISEQIREKVSQQIIKVDTHEIKFTVSIGLMFKETEDESIDQILHKADEFLYKAKQSGRNRVVRSS